MKFILNDHLLMQIETNLDENAKTIFRIVVFFRITHKVLVTDWYKSYENVCKLFNKFIEIYDY